MLAFAPSTLAQDLLLSDIIPIITRARGRDSWSVFYASLCRQQGSTVSGPALRALYNAPESEQLRQQFRNSVCVVRLPY